MREEMKAAVRNTRELLAKARCTEAEMALLIQSAITSPPRGSSPVEAVIAIGIAITSVPRAKEGLLEIANLPIEDRERAQEIAAFSRYELPRFNVGHPHCGEELGEALRTLLRTLWTQEHESCINGAIIVGVIDTGSAWVINHLAIIKAMREMRDADRTMRLGYGR